MPERNAEALLDEDTAHDVLVSEAAQANQSKDGVNRIVQLTGSMQ